MKGVIKRIFPVTRRPRALNWVKDYIDETTKHEGKDGAGTGMGIGQPCSTSRPPGSVTAHGYASEQLLKYELTHHVSGNEAVLGFIGEHLQKRHLRGGKILGWRLVISMDPEEVQAQLRALVDVDQFFESIVEDTFKDFARQVYPGDELGFIMGIRHDAMAGKRHGGQDLEPQKTSRTHVHGQLFVFAQTKQGLPVSFGVQAISGREGQRLDLQHELWLHYMGVTDRHIGKHRTWPQPEVSPGLSFIAREAFLSACEDTEVAPKMQPEERRRFRINRAMFQLKTLDRNMLMAHARRRKQQVNEIRAKNKRGAIMVDIVEKRADLATYEFQLKEERRAILEPILLAEPTIRPDPLPVEFLDINGLRPILLEPPRMTPDRSKVLVKTLQNLHRHRQTARIAVEGVKAKIDLNLAALTPAGLPEWVIFLDEMSRSANPPHQHFLDLGRQLDRTKDDEHSIPAKTIDHTSPPEAAKVDKPDSPSSFQPPSL
jgi:hypothetical protein